MSVRYLLFLLITLIPFRFPLVSICVADDEPDSFDLLGEFPTSEASGRIKAFQLRTSLLYGNLQFRSQKAVSNSALSLDGVQAGLRTELERWFRVGNSHRRPLGLMMDFQFLYAGTFKSVPGDPIHYTSGSLSLGYRVLGYGHTYPWRPEVTVFAGPSVEFYPSMQLYQNASTNYFYTLDQPIVLGAKMGTRLRFPMFFPGLSIEATGYYITPFTPLGSAGGAALSKSDTKSAGGTAVLDYRFSGGMVVGAGIYLGWFKLNYTSPGNTGADQTTFLTRSLITSFRFNF